MKKRQPLLFISILIVFFMFVLVGISTALTFTSNREKAFRIEANKILSAVKKASDDEHELSNSFCKLSETRYCFTVRYLITNEYADCDVDKYEGKVIYDSEIDDYELYLKKSDEFKIIAGGSNDYTRSGVISTYNWKEDYSICDCN